jgi:hypothetical protein
MFELDLVASQNACVDRELLAGKPWPITVAPGGKTAKRRRRIPWYMRESETESAAGGQAEPSGRRIPANLSEQAPNNSYDPPQFYEDREFSCVDCGEREVWTAEQQKWWFETAKGPIYSGAIRCRDCRAARRKAHRGTPRRSHGERRRDETREHETQQNAPAEDGTSEG